MAGRKPKPTAVKKLEGNPGKRKLNTKEPNPGKGMPVLSVLCQMERGSGAYQFRGCYLRNREWYAETESMGCNL